MIAFTARTMRIPTRGRGLTGDFVVDGYFSAELLARISTFAEMLYPGTESTQITRDASAPPESFECEVFTRKNHFTMTSLAGLVRLYFEPIDSREEFPVLLVEVEAANENSADTLRAAVSCVELLGAMRERNDRGGLRALSRLIDGALHVRRWI